MKLSRLRLAQIRQFTAGLEIPDFAPGLNVFWGPNEAGKSTVVRAIRAAFLERYRSSVIDDLLPRGLSASSASPTVEIHFEAGGKLHVLTKTFFHRKRCTYTVDGHAYDGEEAEDAVARMLGFGFALKGASKAANWGIPGLLWIEQGDGHRVAEPVAHARDHLRTALEASVGAVASTAGDEVLARLRTARGLLLTPSDGRPRGDYAAAKSQLEEAAAQLAALDARIAEYQAQVDRLATLRAAQAADTEARPWEVFRTRLAAAEEALAAARQLQAELQRWQQTEQAQMTAHRVLSQRALDHAAQREAARQRERDLNTAVEAREAAQASAAHWDTRRGQAAAQVAAAEAVVTAAEAEANRRHLAQRLLTAAAERDRLAQHLAQAARQADEVARLGAAAQASRIAPADLQGIETAASTLREREITQRAAATAITLALEPGVQATLDGRPVSGTPAQPSEHRITAAATLEIAGVGRIGVVPGESDVADLARPVDAARAALAQALARVGVATVQEARERHERHQAAATEGKAAAQMLELTAPDGLEKLRAALAGAEASASAAQQQLQALPPAPAEAAAPGGMLLEEARAAYQRALDGLQQAGQQHASALQALGSAQAREEAARRELSQVRNRLDDPRTREQELDTQGQLAQARSQADLAAAKVADLRGQIERSQPAMLEQDARRLQGSLDAALAAYNDRAKAISGVEGALDQAGASGLEDQRAELQVRHEALRRRHAELELRASALDLLVRRLEARRQALTRQLQAPLQARLDHYLRLMFPGARLVLDEDLTPGELARGMAAAAGPGTSPAAAGATQVVDFDRLSHGAQEQMALISRLAYADLLQQAGKPTLVILDDALVHSDRDRLDLMQRVLFDAAQRHQVLLLTCHPDRWSGLGVPARELRSFVSAGAAAA